MQRFSGYSSMWKRKETRNEEMVEKGRKDPGAENSTAQYSVIEATHC